MTTGLGKTVGDTTGALGKGDVSGVAAGATGGAGDTVSTTGKNAGDTVEGLGDNVAGYIPSKRAGGVVSGVGKGKHSIPLAMTRLC